MTLCCSKVGPKVLGIVQAIIGVIILIFGFVNKKFDTVSNSSGVTYWGSISFICSGILSAVAESCSHNCLKKVSMVMNLFSTGGGIAATGLFSADLYKPLNDLKNLQYHLYNSSGTPLFCSLLEICMSIWTFVRLWSPCK